MTSEIERMRIRRRWQGVVIAARMYEEGKSIEQISAAINRPDWQVKKMLAALRARLKRKKPEPIMVGGDTMETMIQGRRQGLHLAAHHLEMAAVGMSPQSFTANTLRNHAQSFRRLADAPRATLRSQRQDVHG